MLGFSDEDDLSSQCRFPDRTLRVRYKAALFTDLRHDSTGQELGWQSI